MTQTEHKKYLEEFKEFAKSILSSEEATKSFLIESGINTPTGRLTKAYSPKPRTNKKK